MVSEPGLGIDVVELDAQLFFKETYETRERLVERYGLRLIRPDVMSVAEQHRREGPNLWQREPDRCCHVRKVEPLIRALEPYDAWITWCIPCTRPTRPDEQERAGRWAGSDKLECGIHLEQGARAAQRDPSGARESSPSVVSA